MSISTDSSDCPLFAWLLEPSNPSVRYFALVDLLGRSPDAPEVVAARKAIAESEPVKRILGRQEPEGWWESEARAYGVTRTSGQLLLLSELGMAANARIRQGCEVILRHPWFPARDHAWVPLCYTANCLRFLFAFGYGDDPRLQQGLSLYLLALSSESALNCRYNKNKLCLWSAVKALRAFAYLPAAQRQEHQAIIDRIAWTILDYSFDFEGPEQLWLKFGFPWYYQSDLLDALDALAALNYGHLPRFNELAHFVRQKRDALGRWNKEAGLGTNVVAFEAKDRPSKWITLKGIRVLRACSLSGE